MNFTQAPEQLLRGLFETTRLTVQLQPDSDDVTITIRLPPTTYPSSPEQQKGSPTP